MILYPFFDRTRNDYRMVLDNVVFPFISSLVDVSPGDRVEEVRYIITPHADNVLTTQVLYLKDSKYKVLNVDLRDILVDAYLTNRDG